MHSLKGKIEMPMQAQFTGRIETGQSVARRRVRTHSLISSRSTGPRAWPRENLQQRERQCATANNFQTLRKAPQLSKTLLRGEKNVLLRVHFGARKKPSNYVATVTWVQSASPKVRHNSGCMSPYISARTPADSARFRRNSAKIL